MKTISRHAEKILDVLTESLTPNNKEMYIQNTSHRYPAIHVDLEGVTPKGGNIYSVYHATSYRGNYAYSPKMRFLKSTFKDGAGKRITGYIPLSLEVTDSDRFEEAVFFDDSKRIKQINPDLLTQHITYAQSWLEKLQREQGLLISPEFDGNFDEFDDFFITPPNLAQKIAEQITVKDVRSVCDPSAGSGALLDAVKKYYQDKYGSYNRAYDLGIKFYAIEKNTHLGLYLTEKKYRLIDTDFLKYSGQTSFDVIVMNPPFSGGCKHLLKAWEILMDGQILCLLNKETIQNPYSQERKLLLKIIEDHNGTVEDLGQCFTNADRKTNVEVVLVTLHKKRVVGTDYFKGTTEQNSTTGINFKDPDDLALKDTIGNIVIHFNEIIRLKKESMTISNRMKFHNEVVFGDFLRNMNPRDMTESDVKKDATDLNEFIAELKKSAWLNLLSLSEFKSIMTEKVKKDFEVEILKRVNLEFTKENILMFLHNLRMNYSTIINDAVIEVFDLLTSYFKENRCYFEGWKTNKAWKVGKKFILPDMVQKAYGYPRLNYHKYLQLDDIDRVFAMLDGGKKAPEISIRSILDGNKELPRNTWAETSYFEVKYFDKGTVHFKVKDMDLLRRFNVLACQYKEWLPPAEYGNNAANAAEYKKLMISFDAAS